MKFQVLKRLFVVYLLFALPSFAQARIGGQGSGGGDSLAFEFINIGRAIEFHLRTQPSPEFDLSSQHLGSLLTEIERSLEGHNPILLFPEGETYNCRFEDSQQDIPKEGCVENGVIHIAREAWKKATYVNRLKLVGMEVLMFAGKKSRYKKADSLVAGMIQSVFVTSDKILEIYRPKKSSFDAHKSFVEWNTQCTDFLQSALAERLLEIKHDVYRQIVQNSQTVLNVTVESLNLQFIRTPLNRSDIYVERWGGVGDNGQWDPMSRKGEIVNNGYMTMFTLVGEGTFITNEPTPRRIRFALNDGSGVIAQTGGYPQTKTSALGEKLAEAMHCSAKIEFGARGGRFASFRALYLGGSPSNGGEQILPKQRITFRNLDANSGIRMEVLIPKTPHSIEVVVGQN